MRLKSYWKETLIGSGFLLGGFLMLVGFRFFMPPRHSRAYNWYNDQLRVEQAYEGGKWLIGIGATILVLSLAAGLFIAFAAPKFLAKTFRGVTVEDRIATLSDGTHVADEDAADQPSVKCYLRMRTEDGEIIEARCSREVFCSVTEGTVGHATVSNQKLLGFAKTGLKNYG